MALQRQLDHERSKFGQAGILHVAGRYEGLAHDSVGPGTTRPHNLVKNHTTSNLR